MKNVYLVQRLQAPTGAVNPFSFGGGKVNGGLSNEAMGLLKNIFSFDYMGSAEFEWGAVPTAIKALFTNKSTIAFTIERTDKSIYVICPFEIQEDVVAWLLTASQGKQTSLKEHLGLQEALKGSRNTVGWLKIEDDKYCKEPFMFFVDKDMFDGVCKLFEIEQS
jgi:hypothetical protein